MKDREALKKQQQAASVEIRQSEDQQIAMENAATAATEARYKEFSAKLGLAELDLEENSAMANAFNKVHNSSKGTIKVTLKVTDEDGNETEMSTDLSNGQETGNYPMKQKRFDIVNQLILADKSVPTYAKQNLVATKPQFASRYTQELAEA